jgi:hypothetical protein
MAKAADALKNANNSIHFLATFVPQECGGLEEWIFIFGGFGMLQTTRLLQSPPGEFQPKLGKLYSL